MTPQQFKQARKARKLNQQETAVFLKASYSAVTKWESGNNPIPEWVADKMRETSGKVSLDGLSIEEVGALHRLAAKKGMTPDGLVADLVRAGLKFGGILFLILHLWLSPRNWTAAALSSTAETCLQSLGR